MTPAPLPPDERARLAALLSEGLLDTPAEPEFDALTRFAAELCDAPIALITLVDAERQWFKSRVGLDVPETPRDVAFCAHAILGGGLGGLFEVEDAAADPRFADNPLVTGEPFIRFYAGAPLRSDDGHAFGTVCVIDRVPRRLTDAQRSGLAVLGRQVMTQIALRRTLHRRRPEPTHPTVRDDVADTHASARAPRIGAVPPRFGRFRTLGVIGEGAMATVYAAYDEELQRRIAVKLVHASTDPEEQARVQREAHALARISHPNVVQVFEVGALGPQTFIAMEFIQGVTLTLWQEARTRELPAVLAMYVQAGRGLVAAHSVGIVHRDFKPDNVLVGVDARPRVADFGLARFHGHDDRWVPRNPVPGVTETAVGVTVGTPAYMSLEQYRGSAVDARADQFSFCAALYEALHGVRPFAGVNITEIRDNLVAGRLQPPLPGRRAPPAVLDAILRGLAREPGDRWPTLAALLDHLDRYDPARDAAAASRERRTFTRSLGLLMLAIGAVMLTAASLIPDFYSPANLLAPVGLVLVVFAVMLRRMRARLLDNRFHRLMVEIMFTVLLVIFGGRALAVVAGTPPEHALLLGMVGAGAVSVTLARFVAPFMIPIAAVQLGAAALVALAVLPLAVVDVVAETTSALLFVRAWDRSAAGVYLRLVGEAPPTPR